MEDAYYRVHGAAAPEFSADHAWSALWGSVYSADGSQTQCGECDGAGQLPYGPCESCSGEGWHDAARGYSGCYTAEDLLAYMAQHGSPADTDEVIVFEGQRMGEGFDGEPLVVPTRIVRRLTWAAFKAMHA
jgi:hypothetical protein